MMRLIILSGRNKMDKSEVTNLDDLDSCMDMIRAQFDEHGPQEVTSKNFKETLNSAQRGCYWWWLGYIGKHLGSTKEEIHRVYKEKFLLNIFLGDPDGHPEFAELVQNMNILKKNLPNKYEYFRSMVIDGISHMDASVKNMSDLLTEVSSHARELNIRLPAPKRNDLI